MPGHSKPTAHVFLIRTMPCNHPAPFVPLVTHRFWSTFNGRGPTGEHPPKKFDKTPSSSPGTQLCRIWRLDFSCMWPL